MCEGPSEEQVMTNIGATKEDWTLEGRGSSAMKHAHEDPEHLKMTDEDPEHLKMAEDPEHLKMTDEDPDHLKMTAL